MAKAKKKPKKPQPKSTAEDGRTRIKRLGQERFLIEFKKRGFIVRARQAANISAVTFWKWKNFDKEFIEKFREAEEEVNEKLMDAMYDRAVDGVDEPVFHRGEQCGTIKRYSDQLLILALRARMPEKFREQREVINRSEEELDQAIEQELAQLAVSGKGKASGETASEVKPEKLPSDS